MHWLLLSGQLVQSALVAPPCSAAARSSCQRPPVSMYDAAGSEDGESDDLNFLQTRLQIAVQQEDYAAAAAFRDRIQAATGAAPGCDWASLGLVEWQCDWLERLGFRLPTRVQVNALRAISRGDDAAVVAATGSGKTFSYLLPLIARLSAELMPDEEGFGSFSEGVIKKMQRKERPDGRLEPGIPTPALMIVVPTRELGVQVSMLAYRLLGGGLGNPTLQPFSHPSRHQPGNAANMFTYRGPRDVRVAGVWDDEMVTKEYVDLLKDAHVMIGTPEYLSRVSASGALQLENLQAIAIDEADAYLRGEPMALLMRGLREACDKEGKEPPQTVLVGASIDSALVSHAVESGWCAPPTVVTEQGATVTSPARLQARRRRALYT